VRHLQQLIGGITHGADDGDYLVAGFMRGADPPRDYLNAIGIGNGAAAVFLYD
jgi:hypothetical protein